MFGVSVEHQEDETDVQILNCEHFEHERSQLSRNEVVAFESHDQFEELQLDHIDYRNRCGNAVHGKLLKEVVFDPEKADVILEPLKLKLIKII